MIIAADGATQGSYAAANQHAATAQGHTAPAPMSGMLWGALQRQALSGATHKRNALTVKETTSHSAEVCKEGASHERDTIGKEKRTSRTDHADHKTNLRSEQGSACPEGEATGRRIERRE